MPPEETGVLRRRVRMSPQAAASDTAVAVSLERVGAPARRAPARIVVRPAREADVAEIATFVSAYTADGTLLPRSREDLERHLGDFLVAREGRNLIGCGALQSVEPSLCEVRTLVVAPWRRGRGIGGRLLEALLDEARRRGVPRVFCLTRRVAFFAHHGFAVVDRVRFPLKIWNDCRVCPRLHSCDETAMERSVGVSASSLRRTPPSTAPLRS